MKLPLSRVTCLLPVLFAGLTPPARAQPAGTGFTYQGRLTDAGAPVNGPYDFQLALYAAATGGSQVGPTLTLDDAPVTEGLFTVSLDFGPGVFAGAARFLEIGVRPGPSAGPYTLLGSRQELKPAPHAVFSQVVPWAGIAGKPPGFDDDVDNDTTYSAGSGLQLTGTVFSLMDLGVTTPKIALGAVGVAQINTAQVQARVSGTCPVGQYLRGINSDGTVLCEALVLPNIFTVVAAGNLGTTSMAIGTDGNPAVAYLDSIAGTLGLAHCGNAACNSGNTLATIDAGDVSGPSWMAVGADGLPVLSYGNASGLRVAYCGDAGCTAGNTLTTVDASSTVGEFASIAIGADGVPVVAYYDSSAGTLRVAHCGNAACTTGNSISIVDGGVVENVGMYTSIAIGTDGLPVISYYNLTPATEGLRVAHCGNAACSAGNTLSVVDAPGPALGWYTQIAIGSDGLPAVSYYDGGFFVRSPKLAHCGDSACSAGNTVASVEAQPSNGVGDSNSIAIQPNGLPVIAYSDATVHALKLGRCGNLDCSAGNTVLIVDSSPTGFGGISVKIGMDGLPVISYRSAAGLKVMHCSNSGCQ